ncbi:serine/threonine kinase [Fragilaria crotonensis]|nr:serine/threonine kinase [Fragilaria crotonensis]
MKWRYFKTLDHPNIVRPVETFEYRHSLYLVMELCSGGDLYARDPYSEDDAARIVQSIINAVAYMHRQGISHRDLKYENVMFASTHPMADVKIIDFGLSKKYRMTGEDFMNDAVGTIYSMSPEVLRGNYTKQADLWSCGVLSFMLLSSTMPFYGKSRDVVIRRIVRGKFEFRSPRWNAVSDDAKRFVASLLRVDAQHRPTAEDAARDQWLLTANKPGGRHRKCTSSNIPETMDSVQASIENFANHSRLKKLALMVIAHRSTNDEIGFIRRMFKKYDDNQGYFTLEGFKNALCDYLYTDDEIERIFRGMDIDGSGTVHYFEFLAASMEAHGFINEQQLADAFDRIIDEEDMDADRQVDYKEFIQMWDIESDSLRQRTLQTVARRRIKQNPPHPSRGRSLSFGVIKEDFCGNAVESDTILDGDEFEDEDGDVSFGVQKAISIRRASPISPISTFRTKMDCADI